MSAHTSSRRSRSAWRNGGPPSSTRAPRAARPQVAGARSTMPAGPGPRARGAPRQRASSASPRTSVRTPPSMTAWPWARAQAGRWTLSWGSRPLTPRVAPGVRPARARSTRTWAPRSKPRSSRSIVGPSGDRPLPVVEAEVVDRRLERGVAARPARLPLLQAFQVEKGADLGIAVVHGPEEVAVAGQRRPGPGVGDRHVAVVVGAGLGQDARRAGGECALTGEEQVVGVDHAGGVHLAGGQCRGRRPLPANVVAVEPDADVEAPHVEV